jgi:hypothetical protein
VRTVRLCLDSERHDTPAENMCEVSKSVLGQTEAGPIKEEWRPLISHPKYEVNNMGQVRRIGEPLPLPFWWDERGYRRIAIWNGHRQTQATIHKMVAQVFLPPSPTPKHTVNHIDGIKDNNWAINLEWATGSTQQYHAYRLELRSNRGTRNPYAKLSSDDVREIRRLLVFMRYEDIGKKFGVSKSAIGLIARGKRWGHIT